MKSVVEELIEAGYSNLGWAESVMHNFDRSIDQDVADRLRKEKLIAQYSGWNFCGYVWWDEPHQTYRTEVWCYHSPVTVVSGSLEEIMEQVSEKWGWE